MRNSIATFVSFIALVYFLSAPEVLAQTNNPPERAQSNQERMLQDLLNEVRQLRAIVQRIDANTVRAQITIDRLRAQQEQVLRLTREIFDLREKIVEVRARQQKLKEKIPEMEKQIDMGLKDKNDLAEATREIEDLKQREQNLLERETQLSADLDAARSSLFDLNSRLEALEREIITPAPSGVKPPARKQQ